MKAPSRLRIIPALLSFLAAPGPLLAGNGSVENPWLNGEVTAATLDSGTDSAFSYNLIDSPEGAFLSDQILRVGLLSTRNILNVSSGAYVDSTSLTIGFGSAVNSAAGRSNYVGVKGTGTSGTATLWACDGGFTVGYYGSGNTLSVTGGAAISGTSLYVGQASGSEDNAVQIGNPGSKATFSGDVSVGPFGSFNSLSVTNGAALDCANLSFGGAEGAGYGDFRDSEIVVRGTLSVWGTGSTVSIVGGSIVSVGGTAGLFSSIGDTTPNAGNVVSVVNPKSELRYFDSLMLGGNDIHGNVGTGNALQVADGALILLGNSAGDSFTIRTGNHIRFLDGGYLAFYGDARTALASAIAGGLFQINIEGSWTAAGPESLHLAYFDANSPTADAEGLTETGHEGLAGYTVMSDASMPLVWANAVAAVGGWYTSYWYGAFYSVPASYEEWIWHAAHGWQWVYDNGDGSVTLWDCATEAWWYVNRSWYPAMYNYGNGKWYYYLRGAAPQRVFWDWETGGEIVEHPRE
jgi:hypothetical protein